MVDRWGHAPQMRHDSGDLRRLEHDAPKLIDFGDNIMLQNVDFDHVYDFGLTQSKIIVI
jgi:hypothetical protein